MSVEWGRLRVLDAVARTGSVTRAAAMLHMTGPAVSQQLRRIAAESGVEVVAPDGRGLRLTGKGRVLADYARRVSELMQQADNELHHDDEPAGGLRVGALASIIRGALAPALSSFQQSHPRVEVSVEDGETVDHLRHLASGRVDLVLAESWSTNPLRLPEGVRAQRAFRERICVALPEGHPLSSRDRIDISDVIAEPWASCAYGSDGHLALVQVARQHGGEPNIRHFVADHVTQLALVRNGLALAALPRPATSHEDHGIAYRPMTPELHRDILLLTDTSTPSRALETLTAHILNPR